MNFFFFFYSIGLIDYENFMDGVGGLGGWFVGNRQIIIIIHHSVKFNWIELRVDQKHIQLLYFVYLSYFWIKLKLNLLIHIKFSIYILSFDSHLNISKNVNNCFLVHSLWQINKLLSKFTLVAKLNSNRQFQFKFNLGKPSNEKNGNSWGGTTNQIISAFSCTWWTLQYSPLLSIILQYSTLLHSNLHYSTLLFNTL